MAVVVADLFCGAGGFSLGAKHLGVPVVLSVENDARTARVYRQNFPDHLLLETTLGKSAADDAGLLRLLRRLKRGKRLHLHGSPPCQKISRANRTNPDPEGGLRLIQWFLDLVLTVHPHSWSMEQVPHRAVKDYLVARGVAWECVDVSDHGVPQRRRRLIAGSPAIVENLRRRRHSGPTKTPQDVFVGLCPKRHRLCSGLTNNTIHRNGKYVGYRPMRPGECSRCLDEPAHTVWRYPGYVYDTQTGERVRKFTETEMAALQGFPASFKFDSSKTRSRVMIANALPPPLAENILRSVHAARLLRRGASLDVVVGPRWQEH